MKLLWRRSLVLKITNEKCAFLSFVLDLFGEKFELNHYKFMRAVTFAHKFFKMKSTLLGIKGMFFINCGAFFS